MTNTPELSVVLPAYREEENLGVLLPRLRNTLDVMECSYEIVVVDTITPMDNTVEVCRANNALYINRQNGNRFGDAIRSGIEEARGEYIIFMDADGSHTPEFISNMYLHKDDTDIVIASRYVKGGSTNNPKTLILMSLIVNMLYSVILNLRCRDVSNNFKLYRSALLKELNLYCSNFDIVEEILFKIKRNNKQIRIKEVPFCFEKRMYGYTKRNLVEFMITFLFTLVRLRFGK